MVMGFTHEFVCLDIRAWCYKVTTAKGLKWMCWLRVLGAWGRVICVSGQATRISRQNMKLRRQELIRQTIRIRWVLLVVSEALLILTLILLSNFGQTAAAECRLC